MKIRPHPLSILFWLGLVPAGAVAFPLSAIAAHPPHTPSNFLNRAPTTTHTAQVYPSAPEATQFERIYLSTHGELLGTHTIINNTAIYINTSGQLSLATRDYTVPLDYDYSGRLNRIGTAEVSYDYRGRVEQIGNTVIEYDYRGRVEQIGNATINYTPRGKIDKIGDVEIRYDRNIIDTISANYTQSGARVIVVSATPRSY